jgi:predicted nucleotidyltransferase
MAEASGWRLLAEKPGEFVQRTMVLPLQVPDSGIRIDFIFSYSPYERQALDRVRRVSLGKATVRFASVEDVIVQKVVAGRPRDLEDARGILLKSPAYDRGYIRSWLTEFDRSLEEHFLETFEKLAQSTP